MKALFLIIAFIAAMYGAAYIFKHENEWVGFFTAIGIIAITFKVLTNSKK